MTPKSRRIEAISQWAENWRKGQEIEIIPFRVRGGHVVNRRFTSYFIKIGLSKLVHLYYLSTWEVEIKSIRSLRPIRATWDPVSINKERNKPRDWSHQSTCVFPFNSQSNEIIWSYRRNRDYRQRATEKWGVSLESLESKDFLAKDPSHSIMIEGRNHKSGI